MKAAERILTELEAWGVKGVEQCRRDERKFGSGSVAIDAAIERMTLQEMLRRIAEARK